MVTTPVCFLVFSSLLFLLFSRGNMDIDKVVELQVFTMDPTRLFGDVGCGI